MVLRRLSVFIARQKLLLTKTDQQHFIRHLNACVLRKIQKKGQQQLSIATITDQSESIGAVEHFKYNHAKVRELFSHAIMVHELPFMFTEYEVINLALKSMSPLYEKISRTTMKNDCVGSYEIEKKKIMKLSASANKVSITTDLWKSDQNIQYIVVTCHFVDADFVLQKRILSFVDVPPPHSGIVIYDALKDCLIKWGIDNKVWTITVDNASYNDVAVSNLKSDFELHKRLPLNGKFFHVRCCAHILNILVQCGLKEIDDVLDNIRESVKYITKSVARLQIFSDIVKKLKLPKKKLILDCSTRWNSTYAMLSVALEYKDVFPRFKQRDDSYDFLPSNDDWRKARVVCKFLRDYDKVTNEILGCEYPTSNLFLPHLWTIKKVLDNSCDSPNDYLKEMVRKMKLKFDKYWGNSNSLIVMAAVLDPTRKMQFVKFCFKDIYHVEEEAKARLQEFHDALFQLFDEYFEAHQSNIDGVQSDVDKSKGLAPNVDASGVEDEDYESESVKGMKDFYNYVQTEVCVITAKLELENYLEDGLIVHNPKTNPLFDALSYWKEYRYKYHVLSQMASDILSIPITSVASEAAFSAGSRVIEPHRASLGTKRVQMLICGADWLRYFYGIKKQKVKTAQEDREYDLLD